ncbi:hypothetical protein NDU88_005089 [Pleurodeles waltl]|uniref:Uncharacterized protein n=1 Tax=Pleurodeles waltl TaxID=8319 RepID=A0AAV7PEH7_PLEWA|nr:hypothetical protein NDU88_005089 [Pleurodeles waltl]
MPGGRSSHKNTGRPARQLLFSEALLQAKGVPPPMATQPSATQQDMADPAQESTMDHILQEISSVGRRLEGVKSAMVSLAAETKSIHTEIASFQTGVLGLVQRVSKVEAQASSLQDIDQELLFLRTTLGVPKSSYVGPPENRYRRSPRPIIACLLRHTQACQLIQKARTQGPCQLDGHTIRISADFSKETSDRRRAFLALRPRPRQLEAKYGLFDLARMWITKNGTSKDLYDPEDSCSFLDGWSLMNSSTSTPHRDTMAADQNTPSHNLAPGGSGSAHQLSLPCPRGQDLERLLHSHDDSGQVLHSVALHTQVADIDKSCSPLKPLVEPT